MLQFPSAMQTSAARALPKRSDSLRTVPENTITIAALQEELHDMRRVQAYGQEDDLKEALGRMIKRVEELSALLSQAQKSQAEYETSLKLARSNLQLALANNEMLEEALKRDSAGGGKDVGWRRWSEHPDASRRGLVIREDSTDRGQRQSLDRARNGTATPPIPVATSGSNARSNDSTGTPSSSPPTSQLQPSTSNVSTPHTLPTAPIPAPAPQAPTSSSEGRFFRFRFGSGASSPNPAAASASASTSQLAHTQSRPQSPFRRVVDASHLTSASLPSLVQAGAPVPEPAAGPSKREEELAGELEAERVRLSEVQKDKKALEAEIESLSQALFEEANKMVAKERIRCAEIEEELRTLKEEKEALKGAMRVIELDNARLKTAPEKRETPSTTPAAAPNGPSSTSSISETPPLGADEAATMVNGNRESSNGSARAQVDEKVKDQGAWTPPDPVLPKSPLPDITPEESPWAR